MSDHHGTPRLTPENALYFPALDGIRTLALFMVIGQHYMQMPWGWTGVDVFFVLSGFLITGILYDSRDSPDRLRTFYIRRTLRIFPLYYGILFAFFLTTPIFHWHWNAYWVLWPTYLGNVLRFLPAYFTDRGCFQAANGMIGHGASTLVLHVGHFWSLCLEEQFYLAWPFVVFSVRDRMKLVWICVATIVVSPLLRVAAAATLPHQYMAAEITYRLTPFRFDALLLGGLVALLWRGREREAVVKAARAIGAVGLPLVILLLVLTVHRHKLYQYPSGAMTWGLTVIDVLSASLIVCSMIPGNPAYRLFSLPPLRWLGRISYGAYVYHDIPHEVYQKQVEKLTHHSAFVATHYDWIVFLTACGVTVLISWISYANFEYPLLKLKDRLAPPIRSRAETVAV